MTQFVNFRAVAERKLHMLHRASRLDNLRMPSNKRLEALKRDRTGEHRIRINDQWRICFRFDQGDAWDVEIVDSHGREEVMETIINGMRPIHPGAVLREEFLIPFGLTANALAIALQVPGPRINDVVGERRAVTVTVDTALRLAQYFGTSAEFWLGLQTDYDMALARASMGDVLSRTVRREVSGAA